jgi:hypothetical protein
MNIFPNMATKVFYDYCIGENLNMAHNLSQLKRHASMMSIEARKVHPFFGSCTTNVVNHIDWDFIESLGRNGPN